MLPAIGSTITAAISSPHSANSALAASASLYGRVMVKSASALGTPGESGTPSVSAPEPALTRKLSP